MTRNRALAVRALISTAVQSRYPLYDALDAIAALLADGSRPSRPRHYAGDERVAAQTIAAEVSSAAVEVLDRRAPFLRSAIREDIAGRLGEDAEALALAAIASYDGPPDEAL